MAYAKVFIECSIVAGPHKIGSQVKNAAGEWHVGRERAAYAYTHFHDKGILTGQIICDDFSIVPGQIVRAPVSCQIERPDIKLPEGFPLEVVQPFQEHHQDKKK